MLKQFFCTYDYHFKLIFALLTFGDNWVRPLSRAFSKVKKSVVSAKFRMGSKCNAKHISPNSLINS